MRVHVSNLIMLFMFIMFIDAPLKCGSSWIGAQSGQTKDYRI